MTLSNRIEIARALFGTDSRPEPSVVRISGTATADSSDGTVTVQLEDGDVVEVGTIGSVSAGDTVTVHVQRGRAQVIAAEGWGDAMQAAVDEAQAIAEATGQHFWHDANGAHVTEVTADEWAQSQTGHNIIVNSLGILLRKALNYIAAWTGSALSFYDGNGNTASNVTASFGSAGAQIGKADESHLEMDFNSLKLIDKNGNEFFEVDDLRDSSGKAQVSETFTGNGTTTQFALSYNATDTSYTVEVDGSTASPTKTTTGFTFSTAPASGASVVAVYDTVAPVYSMTFGTRLSTAMVGAVSFSEGWLNTASGMGSHAEGSSVYATGRYCHAEGHNTEASGDHSHAEGSANIASGVASHAEGDNNTASGDASHAECGGCYATGFASHAEGMKTDANGDGSHAEGEKTEANGDASHAQGYETIANGNYQTAMGKYNVADTTSALIIGNGTGENNRSNALTVDWSGNVEAAGGLTLGTIEYIECYLASNTAAGTTASYSYVKVKLDTVNKKYGTTLSLATSGSNRYGVVIGADGWYRLSGWAAANQPAYFAITAAGEYVNRSICYGTAYNGGGLGSAVRKLSAGDVVLMEVERTGSTDPTIAGSRLTMLTVERIG